MITSAVAIEIVELLEAPTLLTDAGVHGVFLSLLAYPCQTIGDLAANTGFDENIVVIYLNALGTIVLNNNDTWSIANPIQVKSK
ncbi:MAG: hypothetical protein RLZZ09_3192 [Pseudomonadota bacterium]|jgi:hypothetical protein